MTEKITLPTEEGVRFLICEDAREEKGGKLTLVGYFPGNVLTLEGFVDNEENANSHILGLTLLFTFIDGAGKLSADLSILDPHGKEILPENRKPLQLEKESGPANLLINLRPLKITLGEFLVKVKLNDEREFCRSFTMVTA